MTTKPFIKWVGGKTQILDSVLELFPTEMENYYEPFLGGGSVLLGLLTRMKEGRIRVNGRIYASDLNSNLISLYKNIQQYPDLIIAEVRRLVDEFGSCRDEEVNRKAATHEEALTNPESYYFWIRNTFNGLSAEEKQSPTASAMLLFMNKTCFRGVYREGPRGFNVPYGNYKNPTILEEAHIYEVSELIKDVVFTTAPYATALAGVAAGDFVYLDPPYAPETKTSFVSYTADGFGLDNHKALFALCSELHSRNVKLVMSNADVQLVRDAFPPSTYMVKVIECRRAINSKKPEAKTNEVLISNH